MSHLLGDFLIPLYNNIKLSYSSIKKTNKNKKLTNINMTNEIVAKK